MSASDIINAIPDKKSTLRTALILVVFFYTAVLGGAIWLMNNRIEALKEANDLLRQQPALGQTRSPVQAEITSHQDNERVDEPFTLSGTYADLPAGTSLRVLVLPAAGGGYWPQDKMNYDEEKKTWSSVVNLGETPGEVGTVIVVAAGPDGQALFDYYSKVGRAANAWVGIDTLTADTVRLDQIVLIRN